MTEIKKLERKHIAPYLPYGLKWKFDGEDFTHDIVGLDITNRGVKLVSPYNDYGDCEISSGKPLLLPMFSLYTEMEDGTVPIVELAKTCYQKAGYNAIVEDGKCYVVNNQNAKIYRFCYDQSHKSFYSMTLFVTSEWRSKKVRYCEDRDTGVHNQLDLFTYLFSHHYDVYDLCSKGLAIDKRSVKL